MPAKQPPYVGILWEGPSPLDAAPLVAIVTSSQNVKTGPMAQVYILRSDIAPVDAVRSGQDVSVCGYCPLRGDGLKGRACYVQLHPGGPAAIWRKYKAGGYGKTIDLCYLACSSVRWGAYGDPAMLPESLVRTVNRYVSDWTGYTHQWRQPFAAWTKGVFMASVESLRSERVARDLGWGTFRVGNGADAWDATVCRNERDGTTCADCLECDGGPRAIYITAHGVGKNFVPAAKLARKS